MRSRGLTLRPLGLVEAELDTCVVHRLAYQVAAGGRDVSVLLAEDLGGLVDQSSAGEKEGTM